VTGCGINVTNNVYTETTYTTGPITSNCPVSATFAINTYTTTATPGPHGSISCTPNPVNYGGDVVCTVTPDTGYHIFTVTPDGTHHWYDTADD
jgi:hypothetical protein